MADPAPFTLDLPWRVTAGTSMTVAVTDPPPAGDSFLRLGLYPLLVPVHPQRHFGCWELPLAAGNPLPVLIWRRGHLISSNSGQAAVIPPV